MKKRVQFLLGLVLFIIISVNSMICNVKAGESEFMNSYIIIITSSSLIDIAG